MMLGVRGYARTWHLPASIAAAIRLRRDFSVLPDQAIAAGPIALAHGGPVLLFENPTDY